MTVGTISFDSKARAWKVKCEPHVAIRLKRVFAGQGRAARELYTISDTINNARDLQWFTERFPLKFACEGDRIILESRANQHRERESAVDAMLRNVAPPQEFKLAVPARTYQKVAATMLLKTGSLLLADDVGLGKTCSAICTLTCPDTLPALVVTLTHLPKQWQAEINRFAPSLAVHIIKGTKPYEITAGKPRRNGQLTFDSRFPDVVIINYHKLAAWAETLAPVIKSVIYDEVQELRRSDSNKYSGAQVLSARAEFRMGLSATPIYNYGGEMYSVLNVLAPGALGSISEFNEEWGYGERIKDPKAFSHYLRSSGLMLRRTRADVGRELPPVSTIPHYIDCDEEALEQVSQNCAELAKLILQSGETFRGEKMQASEQLSNLLRQATGIAKAPFVAEFVRLLLESEKRSVLYGWHREVYSIWMDRLKEFKPVLYTGTESPNQKEQAKEAFTKGDSRVLIISLRSGAGLDGLQHVTRTVVFGELDWSPGVHEQCTGRVARDGQTEPVAAYFLVAEEGSDPIVSDVLGLKKQQIDGIRDPNGDLVAELQVDEGRIRRLAQDYLERKGFAA